MSLSPNTGKKLKNENSKIIFVNVTGFYIMDNN